MLGCLRVFLFLGIVALAAIAVVVFFASRPGIDSSDLTEIAPSDRARSELDARLHEIDDLINQSKQTGVPIPIQLTIEEQELSSKFDALSGPRFFMEFGDLRTQFKENTLVAGGTMTIGRLEFPFRIDIAIRIESGERELRLIRAQIGQVFLPGPLRRGLVGLAERSVDAGFPRPPIKVETLLISEDSMVVSGSTRG